VTIATLDRSTTAPSRADLRSLHAAYHETRDREIRDRLVDHYQGFAAALASRFARHREPHDDLQQAALIGLLNALDRYDPTRGVEFTTFAWQTMLGELKRHFRDRTWAVRVPRALQERYLDAVAVLDELTVELGRSPSMAQIADRMGLTPEEVVEALEVRGASHLASLDAPRGGDDERTVSLADEGNAFDPVEQRTELSPLLARLPHREQEIIRLRFCNDLTQSQIAERLGISQMHVSRLLSQSLAQLRDWADGERRYDGGGPR
jgi:RNA polymerase sigma-B factor